MRQSGFAHVGKCLPSEYIIPAHLGHAIGVSRHSLSITIIPIVYPPLFRILPTYHCTDTSALSPPPPSVPVPPAPSQPRPPSPRPAAAWSRSLRCRERGCRRTFGQEGQIRLTSAETSHNCFCSVCSESIRGLDFTFQLPPPAVPINFQFEQSRDVPGSDFNV